MKRTKEWALFGMFFFYTGCTPIFPPKLEEYGMTEDILTMALMQCSKACELPVDVRWSLKEIPTVGFYRELHNFLRKWPQSCCLTKITIGKFYICIDPELRQKSMCSRPDNVYQFIERIAVSNKPSSAAMIYNKYAALKHLQSKVDAYSTEIQELSSKVMAQEKELTEMKREVEIARAEISNTKLTLNDITSKLQITQRQRDSARNQVQKCQEKLETTAADFIHFEEEVLGKNDELTRLVFDLKAEITDLSSSSVSLLGNSNSQLVSFCFETKDGSRVYTHAIRELYYSLLANQIPPSKIESTIRAILNCFFPSLKLDKLHLPSESCASYMRRHELTTLCLAHKATSVLKQAETGFLHLNTDGTTKSQKKIDGSALNGMVLSVNNVLDGSADSIINDISKELQKLREIAHELKLPDANKINWTLIVSSSSDSGSAQKRFNKLLEEKRVEDEEKFGKVCPEAFELVENFCCMHLGVNLRKAFLDGIRHVVCSDSSSVYQRDHHPVDVFAHEFCKLLGKHGVPEYGLGVLAFPDFLEHFTSPDKTCYYQTCAKIHLDRQIGNRYFVTAANAGKILFLRDAALKFLSYCGKSVGNKLEQDVHQKLQDPNLLSQLKADALMFHHVYCNLVMLAKSKDLDKSAFEMRHHYLELRIFLEEIERNPPTALIKDFKVFSSEERLYSQDKKFNHRLHSLYKFIEEVIFLVEESDVSLLYPLLVTGASAMREKLCTYAHAMLPGGKYWEPDLATESILRQLKPNNDLCESILGLNDYLTTAIPNLSQLSRSNLVQVKKNKTIQWFQQLPREQQHSVVELAVQKRAQVAKQHKEEEAIQSIQRREKMVHDKCRRDALEQRAKEEREKLSRLHLITSTKELEQALSEIDELPNKCEKKRALIKEQVNIWKKVLRQNIKVPFTHKGRQRPLKDLIIELSHFIAANSEKMSSAEGTCEFTPESLVGKKIFHRFDVEGEEKWYAGYVVSYNAVTHLHEVAYNTEDENSFFNLAEDFSNGDLIILNNN